MRTFKITFLLDINNEAEVENAITKLTLLGGYDFDDEEVAPPEDEED